MPSKIEDGNHAHPLYRRWNAMIQRCHRPNYAKFCDYGGRGITVCDAWRKSFRQFVKDIGPCPAGHVLDRIDNDGNYEPSNCRWVTPAVSATNKRMTPARRLHMLKMRNASLAASDARRAIRTAFNCGHPFTAENMYVHTDKKGTQRWCKECARQRSRATYHRNAANQ